MSRHFPEAFQALKDTADALIAANHAMIAANQGIKRAVDAVFAAQDDHEDLREHVLRLENLILSLTKEVRDLRDRNGV